MSKLKILTNAVISFLLLSIATLCLAPIDEKVSAEITDVGIYRSADENTGAVSLMFNVYWGTEEVYRILDILEQHGDKATFFIGGCWADDNVECLKRIVERGHELGNHGYFHKDHKTLSVEKNEKEISDCNQFIHLATGITPTLFAPPSGSYGEKTLSVCKRLGMTTILWSKDTIDWRDKNPSLIYTRATEGIRGGDFVLMHPMSATADALDDILKYYEKNGLETLTVSENLNYEEKS